MATSTPHGPEAPARIPEARAGTPAGEIDDVRRQARSRSLVHPLARLAGHSRDRIRAGLRERGHVLQPAHAGVIIHLRGGGLRLTELAERAGVSKQAMGKLVDELEAIGYLERTPDPADGRAKMVRFSRAGRRLLRDCAEIVDDIWAQYAGLVGETALCRLRDTVERILLRLGPPTDTE